MLITVHRELNLLTAHTVRGLLVSEGIVATLFSEHMIALAWSKSLAYGEVQIQVPSIQADQARAVLADWQQGVFEQALEEQLALPADLCPRCAARDWRPVRAQGALLALLAWTVLMLTLVPAPPPLTGRRCGACGHAEPCRASENAA